MDPNEYLKNLSGRVTSDGWVFGDLVQKQSYQTGGNFSVGYLANHPDGRVGFLKAFDFSREARAPDPTTELERALNTYNFERNILDLCNGARLTRVVVAISHGNIPLQEAPLNGVFYLIFELANGDIRNRVAKSNRIDVIWTLNALHNVATGIAQLHKREIYHQDVKPSNILTFGTEDTSKLADLGRSYCKTLPAPHDGFLIAGVMYYAPPEQLYGFSSADHDLARASADLYLFGSVIYYLFSGIMLTPAILDRLREEHKPRRFAKSDSGWTGYFDDVLPYLDDAYAVVLSEFSTTMHGVFDAVGRPDIADEIASLVKYLTQPDPRLRGHPSNRRMRHGNPYGLDRFISAFARLALSCEIDFKKLDAASA